MNDTIRERIASIYDGKSGTLGAAAYVDHDIYELELETIFRKCWMYLGHESQLAKPGDFLSAFIAEDPVIVSRQKDGSIAAYLNQCRHRGMRLCRVDEGNARRIMCPYHGWTYDMEGGRLAGVPEEKGAYHSELDKAAWGLIHVPKVETYKGLIFGCWDANAPTLLDYLGDMTFYLESLIGRTDSGTEVIGVPHKWTIDCNWKLPAEQFCSDMYHAATTHQSAVRVMSPPNVDAKTQGFRGIEGVQYSDRGHGGGFALADRPLPNVWFEPKVQEWMFGTFPETEALLGRTRAARFGGHSTIFPNLSFLVGTQTLRIWHPRGPNKVEIFAWTLVDRKAPDDVKEAFRVGGLRAFGPGGVLEQDDSDNWVEVQRVLSGRVARESRLNMQMGLGHGISRPDLPGTLSGILSENAARAFYQRWADMLCGDEWPAWSMPTAEAAK
jgi:3-phenylpropionate/trans-cinnamate dioxygenase subunit alpha